LGESLEDLEGFCPGGPPEGWAIFGPVEERSGCGIEWFPDVQIEKRVEPRAFHQSAPGKRIECVGNRRDAKRRRAEVDSGIQNSQRALMNDGASAVVKQNKRQR